MKIKFDITYDANKLKKAMPKMVREYLNDGIISLEKGSKGAIMKGKFEPLSEIKKFIREEGLSCHNAVRTSSNKPLKHSGRLYRSIKTRKKDKSLEFMEYGKYHLGMDKGETFDLTLDDSKKQFGSGLVQKATTEEWDNFVKVWPRMLAGSMAFIISCNCIIA